VSLFLSIYFNKKYWSKLYLEHHVLVLNNFLFNIRGTWQSYPIEITILEWTCILAIFLYPSQFSNRCNNASWVFSATCSSPVVLHCRQMGRLGCVCRLQGSSCTLAAVNCEHYTSLKNIAKTALNPIQATWLFTRNKLDEMILSINSIRANSISIYRFPVCRLLTRNSTWLWIGRAIDADMLPTCWSHVRVIVVRCRLMFLRLWPALTIKLLVS
jgi:hypothetical protein